MAYKKLIKDWKDILADESLECTCHTKICDEVKLTFSFTFLVSFQVSIPFIHSPSYKKQKELLFQETLSRSFFVPSPALPGSGSMGISQLSL